MSAFTIARSGVPSRVSELRAVKVCSRIRIAPDDFARWLDANRLAPSATEPSIRPLAAPAPNGLRNLLDASRDDA